MAHSPGEAPADRDEPGAIAPSGPPRGRPGFKIPILSLLSMIRLPSLGSERHEMMPDAPEGTGPRPPGPAQAASKKRPSARFSIFALKRETRVGLAGLLTFGVFVSALVVKKGWVGKQPITLAIGDPATGPEKQENKPDQPEKQENKPDQPEKQENKPNQPEKKPEAGSADKKPDDPHPVPPAEGPPPQVKLVGEPKNAEPAPPPEIGGQGTVPATLASMPPTNSDGLPPSRTTPPAEPRLADLPPGPSDPLTLPGDASLLPAEVSPTPAKPPVAAADPPPLPEPKPVPTGELPPTGRKPAEVNSPAPSPGPATLAPTPAVPVDPPPSPPAAPAPPVDSPAPAPAAAPPPVTEPAPASMAPPKVEATAPVPAEKPPTLESVPPSGPAPEAAGAATAGALGAGWVVIQSGGRRVVGSDPVASASDDSPSTAPARVADGPRAVDTLASGDQAEPVLHRVRPGENFWTISKLYYRSGRYYKALHAANERQVPNIRELYVGTVLRIPPPEALDRSLIDPPGRGKSDDPAATTASRTARRSDPADEADLAAPVRARPARPEADPEAAEASRRPTYTVKPFETLRSIARDTLNDPRRDREIFNLNRDVLDDPGVLPAGTTLTLPEDAVVGRRAR